MMYQNFGKRVRQQRILAQLTQEKLAEKADISISFLGHIERGTRKASLDTVVKLANALRVSPNILLQDSLESDLLDSAPQISESQMGLLREITNRIIEYGDYNGK
ncbi:MAG: helix-turn-helix transcriptional regulator [Clostridia bacterium]|nr:helix-turn-helix transcriptional regulator [Clostridia bacterium]